MSESGPATSSGDQTYPPTKSNTTAKAVGMKVENGVKSDEGSVKTAKPAESASSVPGEAGKQTTEGGDEGD